MKPSKFNHAWQVDADEAIQIQLELASVVEERNRMSDEIRYVAGVDVAYRKRDNRVYAGVVILDSETLEVIESRTVVGESRFPYIPGLFAFREVPHLLQAFKNVERVPDLVICDGQGIAHPRRCGLASHLGVLLDVPTIGCGKTRHIGEFSEPDMSRGSFSPLVEGEETIGSVLRTQDGIKPLFVSIGHRVSLPSARDWILRLANRYRQPEPIRCANEVVNKLRSSSQRTYRNKQCDRSD
ncbi:MAG: deoxyribonuclease V [Planctomycetota bacterium]